MLRKTTQIKEENQLALVPSFSIYLLLLFHYSIIDDSGLKHTWKIPGLGWKDEKAPHQ